MWQGDLTRKKTKGADNWRWGIGLSADMPASVEAHYDRLAYSFITINNIDIFIIQLDHSFIAIKILS